MIPKKIHYCWFGGNPLDEKAKKCIASWRKFCPDYEIVEWNETNYDVAQNRYIQQAYEAKKWAFVTDYVRLDVIYRYGGIYLDTDVEVIRSLDELRRHRAYAGMENVSGMDYSINTGLGFGAEKENEIVKAWRDAYEKLSFYQENGTIDLLTTPARTTAYLTSKGFRQENVIQEIEGMVIYPTEYLSPKNYSTKELCITENTYSIHHYAETWKTEDEKRRFEEWNMMTQKYGKRIGAALYAIKNKLRNGGIPATVKSAINRGGMGKK